MTQAVALDPAQHAHLRILTSRGAAWGDEAMSALVVPAEFRAVQACYPIVFEPTADGAMNTFVVHPDEGGPHPVVLFYMDAPGKREESQRDHPPAEDHRHRGHRHIDVKHPRPADVVDDPAAQHGSHDRGDNHGHGPQRRGHGPLGRRHDAQKQRL